MPSSKRCCRDSPRCADCPVLVAAAGRARRHEGTAIAALVDEVFGGFPTRTLPDCVTQTLEALDQARRGTPVVA
ncbi:MAG TPA: hypothetical protein VGM33_21400 [Baekduia sp.]|jgi:hypothetical protein